MTDKQWLWPNVSYQKNAIFQGNRDEHISLHFSLKPNSCNPQGFLHVVCLVVIGYTLKTLCTKNKRIMIHKNKTWMFN